jgi:hypothetical protein
MIKSIQMKSALLLVIGLHSSVQTCAQLNANCLPHEFIVAVEKLNFREGPDTNSRIIGVLNNSERVYLIEIRDSSRFLSWYTLQNSWMRVRRNLTGDRAMFMENISGHRKWLT